MSGKLLRTCSWPFLLSLALCAARTDAAELKMDSFAGKDIVATIKLKDLRQAVENLTAYVNSVRPGTGLAVSMYAQGRLGGFAAFGDTAPAVIAVADPTKYKEPIVAAAKIATEGAAMQLLNQWWGPPEGAAGGVTTFTIIGDIGEPDTETYVKVAGDWVVICRDKELLESFADSIQASPPSFAEQEADIEGLLDVGRFLACYDRDKLSSQFMGFLKKTPVLGKRLAEGEPEKVREKEQGIGDALGMLFDVGEQVKFLQVNVSVGAEEIAAGGVLSVKEGSALQDVFAVQKPLSRNLLGYLPPQPVYFINLEANYEALREHVTSFAEKLMPLLPGLIAAAEEDEEDIAEELQKWSDLMSESLSAVGGTVVVGFYPSPEGGLMIVEAVELKDIEKYRQIVSDSFALLGESGLYKKFLKAARMGQNISMKRDVRKHGDIPVDAMEFEMKPMGGMPRMPNPFGSMSGEIAYLDDCCLIVMGKGGSKVLDEALDRGAKATEGSFLGSRAYSDVMKRAPERASFAYVIWLGRYMKTIMSMMLPGGRALPAAEPAQREEVPVTAFGWVSNEGREANYEARVPASSVADAAATVMAVGAAAQQQRTRRPPAPAPQDFDDMGF